MVNSIVKKAIKSFENTNGTKLKEVDIKQLTIILHKEMKDRCGMLHGETENKIIRMENTVEKLNDWCTKTYITEIDKRNKAFEKIMKNLSMHETSIVKIMDALPEKGFCSRVESCLFPEKEMSLEYKVNMMWHDRRWIKKLLGALIALTMALGGGNILIQFL